MFGKWWVRITRGKRIIGDESGLRDEERRDAWDLCDEFTVFPVWEIWVHISRGRILRYVFR